MTQQLPGIPVQVMFHGHFKNNGTDETHYVKELVIPVGAGVKFRLSDVVALDLGYTQNYVDGDNLDGFKRKYPTKDHYSYGYAGLVHFRFKIKTRIRVG
jgi:OOP family OmpA-OmpF porin